MDSRRMDGENYRSANILGQMLNNNDSIDRDD